MHHMTGIFDKKYVLLFLICFVLLWGCRREKSHETSDTTDIVTDTEAVAKESTHLLELRYAQMYRVEFLEEGRALVDIDGDRYLLVPKDGATGKDDDLYNAKLIRYPVTDVYLAASSAMDFFVKTGALSSVKSTSTERKNWSLLEVCNALDEEAMYYIGKYSAPDYEALLELDTDIAIESTMIYHSPQVAEKIESLGIPVMTEKSSFEKSALGRMEWIKLYGLLTGHLEEAVSWYDREIKRIEDTCHDGSVMHEGDIGGEATDHLQGECTVVYFYVSSAGVITVRAPGDYISDMIEMAGGRLLGVAAAEGKSSVKMEAESFFEMASDADYIIYNATLGGNLSDMQEFTGLNPLFDELKAVRLGHVWQSEDDFFQQPTRAAAVIEELSEIIREGVSEDMTTLKRLK